VVKEAGVPGENHRPNLGQFCCCFVVIISMVVGVESNRGQFCCCFVVIISMVIGVESNLGQFC
jgi:hypothetical protein